MNFINIGITITNIDETTFHIFAPNHNALEEAEEMIKAILNKEVAYYHLIFNFFYLLYYFNKYRKI